MTATRNALVTGASRGLGAAIAKRLAASGDRVLLGHRQRREAAEQVRDEIVAAGGQAELAGFDLRDAAAIDASLAELRERLGPITLLVNNAALPDERMFAAGSAEAFDELIEVDLQGAIRCTRSLVRDMLLAGSGVVINVGSVMTLRGQPGQVAYATAKGGLEAFTRALAIELAPRGIRINAVIAGLFDAGMTRAVPRATRERWLAAIPMGRLGRAEELAEVVHWLASDAASYVTGHCMVVDGGLSL
ncbi:SDR family NAD(P)-dependent oxidoreductase [Nannocystaceae bacterium ST9]